ncbi:saccharopine dehydrogenase NADP-binding domain-containing protein [Kineococcus arenarius]|uniref:saccharopine dehydrogenase NADP-binding domain-containing protein n=1 Tax=unclassified Kineococcus TaxID=2621656 RepID=UPI003D7E60F1
MSDDVLVYGAYGHTGRFVVAELLRRGLVPILSGRDATALEDLRHRFPGQRVRVAATDDGAALRSAAHGVAAVVNCAGPFLDTALPVAAAAVSAGAHYLDCSAEQAAVQQLYRAYAEPDSHADVVVLPAMAFYGGLADLLATAAVAGWSAADEVTIAIGLDRWWPTEGTRTTGRRNTATRLIVEDGRLAPVSGEAPIRAWNFPEPLGQRSITRAPFSEIITLARHISATSIQTYLATNALDDIRDPTTPAPQAADASGRSAQCFTVDVVARRGQEMRRTSASGQDIYAVTAPLLVEAVQRLLDGRATARGAAAPGETFDASDFLTALHTSHVMIEQDTPDGHRFA